MKRLAILGASGHGKVVADLALASGWESLMFFDDRWPSIAAVGPWPIVGGTGELLADPGVTCVIVAIGDNGVRARKANELATAGKRLVTLVHPSSVVSRYADLEGGTVVLAGAVVNAFATLGRACIVNTCASVDHDCHLEDAVHVCPGAHLGGDVRVGRGAWIGIGATVRNGISIGAGAIVGAGAAVVADVPADLTVVGVPARPYRC